MKRGFRFILAADVGGTNIRTALVDPQGMVLTVIKRPTLAQKGKDSMIERLVRMLEDTAKKYGTRLEKVEGIGVGFPGPLDAKKGVVFSPPNLVGWFHVPLKGILEKKLGRPVVIENDANAAALGEYWKGAGRGAKSLVCLTLGTGVGGGIVLDGRVWHGAKGIAGEIGHMTVIRGGRRCNCGNRGCLEAYASSRGIIARMQELLMREKTRRDEKITMERIGALAKAGDRQARRTVEDTGVILGIAIANIANILNPEVVVLGGGVSNLGDRLFDPIKEEVKKRALPEAVEGLRIVKAQLGDNAGVIGAARSLMLCLDKG